MKELRWVISQYDPCLFIHHKKQLYLVLYVNNIIVFSKNRSVIDSFKDNLFRAFKMTKDDCSNYFLGTHLQAHDNGLKIHQRNYVQQILNRYQLKDIPTVKTPMQKIPAENKGPKALKNFIHEYISKVGSLIYPAQICRPDIAYTTAVVGRFNANPNQEHMDAVHRIFAYLKGSMDRDITYHKTTTPTLKIIVDSNWGGCPDTYRSTTGWVCLLSDSSISWSSQRQKTVTLSTAEAEYTATTEAAKESVWVQGILNELETSFRLDTVELHIDNNAAMKLTRNAKFHVRTKHIGIKHHFIRELVSNGTITPIRVDTQDNAADILTKPLAWPSFSRHITHMGMICDKVEDSDNE